MQAQVVFEGSEEALDEGDGAVLAEGPEPLPNAEGPEGVAEESCGELRSLIGDEVSGSSDSGHGATDQVSDGGGGLEEEDGGGEGHA
jgi:hypothetical protein